VVVLLNCMVVGIYYGNEREALEAEVITWQIDRLKADLARDPPRIGTDARALYDAYPTAYAFALLDQDGTILDAANPGLIPLAATETGIFAHDWVTRLDAPTGSMLVAGHTLEDDEGGLRLLFVMLEDPANLAFRAYMAEFNEHVWLPLLPLIVLLIGTNIVLIQHGLAPVAAAAAWARSVHPGAPTPPAPNGTIPAEIADLVSATQRSLDRLNAALAAEKRHAAEAAHALRTPVAVLVARLDALPPGETTERLRGDLEALSRTVRQVLASARADRLETGASRADLGRIAETITAALAPFAWEKGVELSLALPPEPVVAQADRDGVEVALSNLVENAILHAGPGLVEISVGRGPSLCVRDYGPGLPPGAHAHLFEPFWRGEGAATGGTGLGLAIVARLQRAQGGGVEVHTPAGGGVEFILSFRPAPTWARSS
jgi:two-component system OmpR family sensor kinase